MPPRFSFPQGGQVWMPMPPETDLSRGNRFYAGAIALAIVAPQVAAFGYLAIAVVGVLRARGDETAPPEPA